MVVALESGGSAGVEFLTATALGPTNSTLSVASLLRSTLPLLSDLTEREQELLAPVLAERPRTDDLFSMLDER